MPPAATLAFDQLHSSRSELALDDQSIDPRELSLSALMRELNLQQRPSWLLRKLMGALEERRQAQGLGWSRPWNKAGLTVFRTHVQHPGIDRDYFVPLFAVLARLLPAVPPPFHDFIADLCGDPAGLAFTFYHNRQAGGAEYEGLTLSLGRRVDGEPSKRDRLDLILEDRREHGRVDGRVDLVRLYVCPWAEYRTGQRHFLHQPATLTPPEAASVQELYVSCLAAYQIWKDDPQRQWRHWSAGYIDYFGPRSFIPVGSSFL